MKISKNENIRKDKLYLYSKLSKAYDDSATDRFYSRDKSNKCNQEQLAKDNLDLDSKTKYQQDQLENNHDYVNKSFQVTLESLLFYFFNQTNKNSLSLKQR